jgi:hypothetical protein
LVDRYRSWPIITFDLCPANPMVCASIHTGALNASYVHISGGVNPEATEIQVSEIGIYSAPRIAFIRTLEETSTIGGSKEFVVRSDSKIIDRI